MAGQRLRIAIIGAGIMGLLAARLISRNHPGAETVVYDGQGSAGPPNASTLAGGMLAPDSECDHLPVEYRPAALESINFWGSLPHVQTGFVKAGSLILAHAQDHYILERFQSRLTSIQSWQNTNRDQLLSLEPELAPRFGGGIYMQDEAHLCPAMALAYLRSQAGVLRVERYEIDTARREFDWVIDCRGYAAHADLPNLRGVKGEVILMRNRHFTLHRPLRLMHPRYPLYIVPRPGHQFLIGATLLEAADLEFSVKSALELLTAAYSLHPSFAESEIISLQAGIRPAYPDNLPRMAIENNIIRCNGLFRHGYLLAPVLAGCAADYINGRSNQFMHLFMRP